MPLFMLVCGYFSLNAFHRGFKEFIYKKTIQLLVPAFVVSFFSIALYFAWGELSQGGGKNGAYRWSMVPENAICMLPYRLCG